MNSKSVIKRTLPLIIVLLVIIGIAVSFTVFRKDPVVPAIADPEGEYLSVTEAGRTYSITNQKMYEQLKLAYGESVLLDKIDADILKALPKGTSNYYDVITLAEIDAAIEKAIFPDGRDGLDAEEIQTSIDEYYDGLYTSSGLRTEDDVRAYHRLILAKKLYATDQLTLAVETADAAAAADEDLDPYFTDDEISTYYDANYMNGYWTIIVPFATAAEGEDLLAQLGYSIHEKDADTTTDFNRWVKDVGGVETSLTPYEIVKAFIDMYNTVHSGEIAEYPASTLTLVKDTQYGEIAADTGTKIVFGTEVSETDEALNELYFTYDELVAYQSEIENYIKRTMKETYEGFVSPEISSTTTWYTPTLRSYESGELYCFILKIAEEVVPEEQDVAAEIKAALFEKELTQTYINTAIVKLRAEKGLVIYDPDLEESYISTAKSYSQTFATSKETSETLIAKVGEVRYSADELFDRLDKKYGITLAYAEINYQRMLNSLEFNQIYDYYLTEAPDKDRILDAEKWGDIITQANNLKNNFVAGAYQTYGFGPDYGWKNFIRDVYGAEDDHELLYALLYSQIKSDYAASLGDLEDLDETSALWQTYVEKMQSIVDDYYSVAGIQLLICVNDADGNKVDPADWTVYQTDLAKELYQQIWAYMAEISGESAAKFQAIADAFTASPRFLATVAQDLASQPAGFDYVFRDLIEVAKFKSAGLSLEYTDLGTFTNGSETDYAPTEAAKIIWDATAVKPSTEHTPYLNEADGLGNWTYLVTENGYHAYINTSVNQIAIWDEANSTILPTFLMVKTYLADSAAEYLLDADGNETEEEFTTAMGTAVTSFFTPVKTELTGTDYSNIQLFSQMKALNITFNGGNYTREEFNQFLDLQIATSDESLAYFGTK